MESFSIAHNAFNGTEVTVTDAPITKDAIRLLLETVTALKKDLVWITLSIEQSYAVPLLTEQGFVFHLCQEDRLTLIHRIKAGSFAPFAPTHTIGVGGFVENERGEVLLIRDRMMKGKGFKLPGGYVDLGEGIESASEREVFEETGVQASFTSMVGFVSKHPHEFNKANLYIVCSLTPHTAEINIQDTAEIEAAVWMPIEEFLADQDNSRFHRYLVHSLTQKKGLTKNQFEFDYQPEAKREIFLSN